MEKELVLPSETQQQEDILFSSWGSSIRVIEYFFLIIWPKRRIYSCVQGLETSLPILQRYPDQQEKSYTSLFL